MCVFVTVGPIGLSLAVGTGVVRVLPVDMVSAQCLSRFLPLSDVGGCVWYHGITSVALACAV